MVDSVDCRHRRRVFLLVLCAPQKAEVNGGRQAFALLREYDAGYDGFGMQRLNELINAGVKTPRAALERDLPGAGSVSGLVKGAKRRMAAPSHRGMFDSR